MKIHDCEKEIKDRHYMIGTELQHASGNHKIKINSLEPQEVKVTGLYFIQCHYYKQNEAGIYGTIRLANKLNDVLAQYLPY